MIDLDSIITLLHKAKWTDSLSHTKLAECPGRTRWAIRRSGNLFGYLSYQQKKHTLLSSRIGRWSRFWLRHHLCALREAISFSPANCQKGDDIEINNVSPLTQTMRWKWRHFLGSLTAPIESEKWTGCKEQQNFWSIYSQPDTKCANILSPLTTHGFIKKSIGSGGGLQRMVSREQGRDEGLITTR
jgi:hypothetical protein